MVQLARNFLRSVWKRAFRSFAHPAVQPREIRGLFSQLTQEQKTIGLGYKGPTNHGDEAFLVKNQQA